MTRGFKYVAPKKSMVWRKSTWQDELKVALAMLSTGSEEHRNEAVRRLEMMAACADKEGDVPVSFIARSAVDAVDDNSGVLSFDKPKAAAGLPKAGTREEFNKWCSSVVSACSGKAFVTIDSSVMANWFSGMIRHQDRLVANYNRLADENDVLQEKLHNALLSRKIAYSQKDKLEKEFHDLAKSNVQRAGAAMPFADNHVGAVVTAASRNKPNRKFNSVLDELLFFSGIRKPSKITQAFLNKLVEALDRLEDDNWETISRQAQEWLNAAAAAVSEQYPLPDIPGYVDRAADKTAKSKIKAAAKRKQTAKFNARLLALQGQNKMGRMVVPAKNMSDIRKNYVTRQDLTSYLAYDVGTAVSAGSLFLFLERRGKIVAYANPCDLNLLYPKDKTLSFMDRLKKVISRWQREGVLHNEASMAEIHAGLQSGRLSLDSTEHDSGCSCSDCSSQDESKGK